MHENNDIGIQNSAPKMHDLQVRKEEAKTVLDKMSLNTVNLLKTLNFEL